MKVFKILALALALVISVSGCSCAKKEIECTEDTNKPVQQADSAADSSSEKQDESAEKAPESENKAEEADKAEEKNADTQNNENPEHTMYYWCMEAEENNLNISYHMKDCKLIKDETPTEVGKELIKMIGLNSCEECNPPEFQ